MESAKKKIGIGSGIEIVGWAMSDPAFHVPQAVYYSALVIGFIIILWGASDWLKIIRTSFCGFKIPLDQAVQNAIDAKITIGLPFNSQSRYARQNIALELIGYGNLYGIRDGATII